MSNFSELIESLDASKITEVMSSLTNLDAAAAAVKTVLADKKGAAKGVAVLEKMSECATTDAQKQFFALTALQCCENLLNLGAEAKLAKSVTKILKAAIALVKSSEVAQFLPIMLASIEKPFQNKWKIKVVALELLATEGELLKKMTEFAAKQLQHNMADLVRILVGCSKEVRAEIKNVSAKLLQDIGKLVKCAEIQTLSKEIINCLVNFGNMKLATETLYKIANTTFLSYVDAASFALLFPIVERAMKERQFDSKKNGIMIVGASIVLIEDPDILQSYLPSLLPILQELALDPVFEIQRESAKSLGCLAKNLPELCQNTLLPWCLEKIGATGTDIHHSQNERTGSAHALAEILNQSPDTTMLDRLLREVIRPRCMYDSAQPKRTTPEERAGCFSLIEFLCKVDAFEKPATEYVINWVLEGLTDPSKLVHDQAKSAGDAIMVEFGGGKADAFVKAIADAVLSFNQDHRLNSISSKGMCIALFRKLVEKVSESRKYGTDMMSMDCCSMDTRRTFICLLQITRVDEDPEVRRQSNKVLAEQLQSVAQAKKDNIPFLLSTLKDILSNTTNANKKISAQRCLDDLLVDRTLEDIQAAYDAANAADSIFMSYDWAELIKESCKGEVVKTFQNKDMSGTSMDAAAAETSTEWKDLEPILLKNIQCNAVVAESVKDLKLKIVTGVVLESLTAASASENLKKVVMDWMSSEEIAAFEGEIFPKVYADYHPRELKVIEDPDNVLCHVDNLMLMYGGGHMLLKDTTLEMRKGKRYGVLGRNGTGKTTLMNLLASGNVPGVPKEMSTIHVNPHVLDKHMETKCLDFMKMGNPDFAMEELQETLVKVEFPEYLWKSTIAELSGGWRMRLLIAEAMMKKADVLLLDEPTNHLDINAVKWLCDYLISLKQSSIMVISHDPYFLNRVCTDIINYNKGKLVYYEGNFDAFISRMGISAGDAEAILSGNVGVGVDGVEREEGSEPATPKKGDEGGMKSSESATFSTEAPESEIDGDETPASSKLEKTSTEVTENSSTPGVCAQRTTDPDSAAASGPDRKARISFPIPGKVKGITSLAKPVLEIENLTWAYNQEKGDVIKGVSAKITMNSRIHIKGVNGAGKTSLMNMVCGEIHPNASALPQKGTVNRHRNCRLAYMAQQHMHHMKEFMNSSPYIYIQKRYQNGYDGALQQRLIEPANEEEREDRIARAKVSGKYGNMIKTLVGRQLRGKDMWYEAQWENCPDQKQNTWVNMEMLQKLGCECFALAYDDRAAAAEGGIDQRPLSQREITKHLELFGITEELALNRTIGMFSAGQKSKVSLAAAFWIKPHLVALDEPTNYIDMETLDALTTALQRFKGGVICISHCAEFAEKVCNETWFLEGGAMKITKNDKK